MFSALCKQAHGYQVRSLGRCIACPEWLASSAMGWCSRMERRERLRNLLSEMEELMHLDSLLLARTNTWHKR